MDNKQLTEQLEKLVDLHGMKAVVESLAEVCTLKAAHLNENWQDFGAQPKAWDRIGKSLESLAAKIDWTVLGL